MEKATELRCEKWRSLPTTLDYLRDYVILIFMDAGMGKVIIYLSFLYPVCIKGNLFKILGSGHKISCGFIKGETI